jgi:EpsI family protein
LRAERLISENGKKRWAWRWYLLAESATADPFRAKLLQLKTRMLGTDPAAAVIVVSVEGFPEQADAEMAAERFLDALPPTEAWLPAGREGAGLEGGE